MNRNWTFYVYLLLGVALVFGLLDWVWGHKILQVGLPDCICGAGVLILAYGLVRDLILLWIDKSPVPQTTVRIACLCLESNVGLLLVFLGLLLRLFPVRPVIALPEGGFVTGASLLLLAAHATRDWVLVLTRIPDHRSILPSWPGRNRH
jgi:hypothetical protein